MGDPILFPKVAGTPSKVLRYVTNPWDVIVSTTFYGSQVLQKGFQVVLSNSCGAAAKKACAKTILSGGYNPSVISLYLNIFRYTEIEQYQPAQLLDFLGRMWRSYFNTRAAGEPGSERFTKREFPDELVRLHLWAWALRGNLETLLYSDI